MKLIEIHCVHAIIFFGKKMEIKGNSVRIAWCYVENCLYLDILPFDPWVPVTPLVRGILGNLNITI